MNKYLVLLASVLLLFSSTSDARFSQADTWQGLETQPLTLNKYTYVQNDPARLVDPSGNIATISGLLSGISARGGQSGASHASFRVTFREIGKDVACFAVEEIVSELIIQKLTGGVYILQDGVDPYVGRTNDFDRRVREHTRDVSKRINKILALFHIDSGVNNQRLIEQLFIETYRNDGVNITNTNNSIAPRPASNNSRNLRRIVKNLDFCK